MTRKICYVTGTRADYGLMRAVLNKLDQSQEFDLSICVTGMHLSERYGHTVDEIIADGLRLCAEIPVSIETNNHLEMAKSIGFELVGMAEVFDKEQPDCVMLLGDRGEMLAAAIAAVHLNIPIIHFHGGERSGTVDEMIRHSISKLAHYHFVATEESKNRLIKMGEHPETIFTVGAPGLDAIAEFAPIEHIDFCRAYNFDFLRPIGLIIFHPVVQETNSIQDQFINVIEAALSQKLQLICFEPNSDAGGHLIRTAISKYQHHPDIKVIKHLHRNDYLNCLANVNLMIGNSSSGIIEAASFDLPVVNIGTRQNLRERSENIIDVGSSRQAVKEGIVSVMQRPKQSYKNVYGDGMTASRCYTLLKTINLESGILNKYNAY